MINSNQRPLLKAQSLLAESSNNPQALKQGQIAQKRNTLVHNKQQQNAILKTAAAAAAAVEVEKTPEEIEKDEHKDEVSIDFNEIAPCNSP